MNHRSCGQDHAPWTACPNPRDLATEARRLSVEVETLRDRVAAVVDPIAAIPARDAMLRLDDLVHLLDTVEVGR